jgi:hypothetical protein
MMTLIEVLRIEYADESETALLFALVADIGRGNEYVPFVYRESDPHGLSPIVSSWLVAHPDFPILPFSPPTEVSVPRRIAKNAIWSRVTDDEAVQIRRILSEQTVRIQEIYAGASHLSTDDEVYPLLMSALVGFFGEARAKQLLLPTD